MDWNFLTPLLGGALGAAFINGLVALYKLNRDNADEHEKWMRDNKQEAYARFISAVVEATLTQHPEEKAKEAQQKQTATLSEVRLVAPANVTAAAVALGGVSGRIFRLNVDRRQMMPDFDSNRESIEEIGKKVSAALREVPELTESFVSAARSDIRTEKTQKWAWRRK